MMEILHRGCSSDGRAIASHAIGTGIDARHLQFYIKRILIALYNVLR